MNLLEINQSNKVNEIKEKLLNWRKELINDLTHKENKTTSIILIDKDIIDNDIKTFFNYFNLRNESKNLIESESSKLNKEINENSKFYILDDKFTDYVLSKKNAGLKASCEGYFLNKILLIVKEQNYFFLYLDEKKEIKKGFFRIDQEKNDIKIIIINFFKENEPIKKDEFFNKYNIKYQILEDNSVYGNKNEKEKEKENNIFNKEIQNFKFKMKANSFNEGRSKNIDENSKNRFDCKSLKFQNKEKDKEIKIFAQKKKDKDDLKAQLMKRAAIPKYYPKKYNSKKTINEKEKENISINIDGNRTLNSIKDFFNPKKTIVKKRTPSFQNKNITKEIGHKNSKFNLEIFFPKKKALHRLSTPGVIGLPKISNIPFINSTIQCLSNVQRLKFELISKETYNDLEKNKSNNKKLSFAFAEVLKNLWENLHLSVYEPKNFIKVIQEHKYNKGQILKEPLNLIKFLLKEIHYELNVQQDLKSVGKQEINLFQNNALSEIFKKYRINYENKHNSIIIKEFNGYYINKQGCFNCNNFNISLNKIHKFKYLNFPLYQIKNFKNYNFNCINIYDCFEFFERKNQIYLTCNKCGLQMTDSSKLLNMPNTLIINFEHNKENKVKVIYEEFLNLKKYIEFNNGPFYYELIGALCNANSDNGNNFIAYCKNENCEWYKYNDSIVTKSSFKEIEELPYVLFFSYIQV